MGERIVSAEEARKLLDGATPGPWRKSDESECGIKAGHRTFVVDSRMLSTGRQIVSIRPPDAALIAAAPDLAATVVRLYNILAADRSLRRIAAGAAGMKVADDPPEWDAICEERIRAAYKLGYYNGYHTGSGDDYNDDIDVAKEPK